MASSSRAIPAEAFFERLEKSQERLIQAIAGISIAPPVQPAPVVNVPVQPAPVVNVPQPVVNVPQPVVNVPQPVVNVPAPVVNINVQSIVDSIQNLQQRLVTPEMVAELALQLDQLGNLSNLKQDSDQIITQLQTLIGEVASSVDIQNVIQAVLTMTETIEDLEQTLQTGFLAVANTNELSFYLQDPEFFEPQIPGQPRISKSKDELINLLTKRGLISFENRIEREKYLNMTESELKQLAAVKSMINEQAKAIYDYKTNQEKLIPKNYRRSGFDMFVKDGEKNLRGTPLSKEVKFIYDKIPPVYINFKNGKYECHQDGKFITTKNFRDAERFANKGGFYSQELSLLRQVEKTYFKKQEPLQVIFKARKI